MDLAKLTLTELRRLQSRIETEITRRTSTARKDLLKKVQKLAAEAGLSLNELVAEEGSDSGKKTTAKSPVATTKKPRAKSAKLGVKVPVKYRHPENPALAWTGRGRKPKWVEEWLSGGGSLEQVTIAA